MPHHKISYRTEDGKQVGDALRHAPAGERPDLPLKGDAVQLDGRRWEVKEVKLFPTTDSAIVVVVPA